VFRFAKHPGRAAYGKDSFAKDREVSARIGVVHLRAGWQLSNSLPPA
jgi:hypothetical protein